MIRCDIMWFCWLLGYNLIHRAGNVLKVSQSSKSAQLSRPLPHNSCWTSAQSGVFQRGVWRVGTARTRSGNLTWRHNFEVVVGILVQSAGLVHPKSSVWQKGCVSTLEGKSEFWSSIVLKFLTPLWRVVLCRGCVQTARWVWHRATCLSPQDWETGGCSSAALSEYCVLSSVAII